MLSVLSTPWTKPAAIQRAVSRAARATTALEQGRRPVVGRPPAPDSSCSTTWSMSAVDPVGPLEEGVALEGAEADVAPATAAPAPPSASGWARRRAPAPRRSRSARRSARSARPAPPAWRSPAPRAPRPSASGARRRSATRASGPSPWCPRSSSRPGPGLAQLGEDEAAAVAELGVVNPELVAVVALRQRRVDGCPAGARSAPKWAIHSSSVRVSRPDASPPPGRCGSAGSSAGKPPAAPDRRTPAPAREARIGAIGGRNRHRLHLDRGGGAAQARFRFWAARRPCYRGAWLGG